MATQLSAITMIGTTGQGYTDGMRFIQFYFGAAAGDDRPVGDAGAVLPRRGSTPRTSTWSGASTRRRARFTSLLFLVSRGMSLRRRHVGAGRRAVARARA